MLSPQRIALKVAPEASQLDFATAVTISGVSVPAITTRRTDTTVELGDGESFVIGVADRPRNRFRTWPRCRCLATCP